MENYIKLVRRAKRGDIDAFAELYAGIYENMYRFALYTLRNTNDAEDAVSDAVTDAFASIRKLRSFSASSVPVSPSTAASSVTLSGSVSSASGAVYRFLCSVWLIL